MTQDRHIITAMIDWQGMSLSVAYEADWLSMESKAGFSVAHLQIETFRPKRAPLPFTETGYRSHFLPAAEVDEAGGAIAYVMAWLDHAATSPEWRTQEDARRQLSLF